MKILQVPLMCSALLAPLAMAQSWEVGVGVGGGFYSSQNVTSFAGSVSAKLQTGTAGGAWFGYNLPGHWSGELRYKHQMDDLALISSGTATTFGVHTQQFHYDIIWRVAPSEARIRPFVSAGAGIKLYDGTGAQIAYQPLSNFALLTQQQDLTPLVQRRRGRQVPDLFARANRPRRARLSNSVSEECYYTERWCQGWRLFAGRRTDDWHQLHQLAE